MLRQAILHFGPPKTGTSTIQTALASASEALAVQGIYYHPSHNGHPTLAWEILEMCGLPAVRLTRGNLGWPAVLDEAERRACRTLLVSAEDFTLGQFSDDAFRTLRDLLFGIEIRVVFGLRAIDALLKSKWQQSVKWNIGAGEQVLDFDDAMRHLAKFEVVRAVPYLELVERSLLKGAAQVRLFTVPRRPDATLLVGRFAEAAGLPPAARDAVVAGARENVNESLPPVFNALLLRFNQRLAAMRQKKGDSELFQEIDRRTCLVGAIADTIAGGDAPAMAGETRATVEKTHAELVAWLRDRRVYGDIADLALAP